jgi:hypothetical protein
MFQRVEREGFTALRDVILATLKAKLLQEHELCDGTLHECTVVSSENETLCIVRILLLIQFAVLWLVVFGRQHKNKNKTIELLTLVLFDSCYMFLVIELS